MLKRLLIPLSIAALSASAFLLSSHSEAEAATALPAFTMGDSVWTVTSGPTRQDALFEDADGDLVELPGLVISGSIDPPLSSPANLTGARLKYYSPDNQDKEVDPLNFNGGANGASFTAYLTERAAPKNCPAISITYTDSQTNDDTSVCFENPLWRRVARVKFPGLPFLAEGTLNSGTLEVTDANGDIDPDFSGQVQVSAASFKGSGGRLDGSFGPTIVDIQDGTGAFQFELVRGLPDDRMIFEIRGTGRIGFSQSSMPVNR